MKNGIALDFTKPDLTRIRHALYSCALSLQSVEKPTKAQVFETNELASILSRVVALLEAGQDDTIYSLMAIGSDGKRDGHLKIIDQGPSGVPKRLPGLGG